MTPERQHPYAPPLPNTQAYTYAPDRHIEQVGDRIVHELSVHEIVLLILLGCSVMLNIIQHRILFKMCSKG